MLYLESPRAVGFSYRDSSAPEDNEYNDDKVHLRRTIIWREKRIRVQEIHGWVNSVVFQTASDVVIALKSFFRAFPEYANRDFYVTGKRTITSCLSSRLKWW